MSYIIGFSFCNRLASYKVIINSDKACRMRALLFLQVLYIEIDNNIEAASKNSTRPRYRVIYITLLHIGNSLAVGHATLKVLF